MKLKEAMKKAKATREPQVVDEGETSIDVKVNISIRLDPNVLNGLKAEAKAEGLPYQTWINSILKKHLTAPKIEERLLVIEQALQLVK